MSIRSLRFFCVTAAAVLLTLVNPSQANRAAAAELAGCGEAAEGKQFWWSHVDHWFDFCPADWHVTAYYGEMTNAHGYVEHGGITEPPHSICAAP